MSKVAAFFLALALAAAAPAAALAQGYQPFDAQAREPIAAGPFVVGAYGFIWAAVLVYVVLVARRLARVKDEIEDLRRKLERPPGG